MKKSFVQKHQCKCYDIKTSNRRLYHINKKILNSCELRIEKYRINSIAKQTMVFFKDHIFFKKFKLFKLVYSNIFIIYYIKKVIFIYDCFQSLNLCLKDKRPRVGKRHFIIKNYILRFLIFLFVCDWALSEKILFRSCCSIIELSYLGYFF